MYAIVAGNPARLIRYRCEDNLIEDLMALQWSDEKLLKYGEYFNDPHLLVKFIKPGIKL